MEALDLSLTYAPYPFNSDNGFQEEGLHEEIRFVDKHNLSLSLWRDYVLWHLPYVSFFYLFC